MKIFRNKTEGYLDFYPFTQWIIRHSNDVFGKRIGISWKVGKKRKLRSYHITWIRLDYYSSLMDTISDSLEVTFTKNGKSKTIDDLYSSDILTINDL